MSSRWKNVRIVIASAAFLTLGAAGVAFAHPGHGRRGDGGDAKERAAETARFDKNGDGKLDDQERRALEEARRAAHEQRRAEMLAKYDANKDGQLDDQERAKLHADKVAERFTRLDTNGDGVLSREEFAAGAALEHERGTRSAGKGAQGARKPQ